MLIPPRPFIPLIRFTKKRCIGALLQPPLLILFPSVLPSSFSSISSVPDLFYPPDVFDSLLYSSSPSLTSTTFSSLTTSLTTSTSSPHVIRTSAFSSERLWKHGIFSSWVAPPSTPQIIMSCYRDWSAPTSSLTSSTSSHSSAVVITSPLTFPLFAYNLNTLFLGNAQESSVQPICDAIVSLPISPLPSLTLARQFHQKMTSYFTPPPEILDSTMASFLTKLRQHPAVNRCAFCDNLWKPDYEPLSPCLRCRRSYYCSSDCLRS